MTSSRETPPTGDALGDWLRAGDPVAGDPGLDAGERSRIRHSMLAAAERPVEAPRRLAPALTAAAGLVAALGAAWLLAPAGHRGLETRLVTSGGAAGAVESAGLPPTGRQVRFTTPGGTQVVWLLMPRDE